MFKISTFPIFFAITLFLVSCTGSDSFRNQNPDSASVTDVASASEGNGKGFGGGNGQGYGGLLKPIINQVLFPREKDLIAGDIVTILGTNFSLGATVTVGGIACSPVTFVDSTRLTCLMVANLLGTPGLVIVTNPDGSQGNYSPPAASSGADSGAPAATYARVLFQSALNSVQQAGAGGMAQSEHAIVAGGKLFVADSLNNRIAVWNTVPITDGTAPNFVLGQTSLNGISANYGGVSAGTLFTPFHLASDGSKLVVADKNNHRVLIWNALPLVNGAVANVVLGQPDMSSNTVANGGISKNSLNSPTGVFYNGGKLFVADSAHNRILIWDSLPSANNQMADRVLGQADFVSSGAAVSQSAMNTPTSVWSDGTKVIVADSGNNRVMIWNTYPDANGKNADIVLGQPDFVTRSVAAVSSQSLSSPKDVYVDSNGKLFVMDVNNNRLLIWNSIPVASYSAANVVVGQANMNSNVAVTSASQFQAPSSAFSDGTKLYVPNNSRVLIWNSIPVANGTAANTVVGQTTFNNGIMNSPALVPTTSRTAGNPKQIHSNGEKFAVVDSVNNRVLLWNAIPSSDNQDADVVVGQANMSASTASLAANRLSTPWGVHLTSQKLMVADQSNNRVLIWNTIPTVSGVSADVVLGQVNFTQGTANQGAATPTAITMNAPNGIYSDGTKLFVADRANHRVLIWNAIPTTNDQPADLVLGQATMLTNSSGTTSQKFSSPISVWSDGTRVVVSDRDNHRVLIWTSFPTVNGQAANIVLGQPDMTTAIANPGGVVSAQTLNSPGGIYCDGTKLYVMDTNNKRILVWNSMPLINQKAADSVLGQPNLVSNLANNGLAVNGGLNLLQAGIWSDGTRTFVVDGRNNRVLLY